MAAKKTPATSTDAAAGSAAKAAANTKVPSLKKKTDGPASAKSAVSKKPVAAGKTPASRKAASPKNIAPARKASPPSNTAAPKKAAAAPKKAAEAPKKAAEAPKKEEGAKKTATTKQGGTSTTDVKKKSDVSKKSDVAKKPKAAKLNAPVEQTVSGKKSVTPRKPAASKKERAVGKTAPEVDMGIEDSSAEDSPRKRKYTRRSKKAPVPIPKYQGKQGLLLKKKGDAVAPVKPREQKHYGEKDLEYFRQIIMQKITDANDELMSIEERLNDSSSGEFSEDSTYSLHMADQGTDAMEREKAYLFAARERKFISHLTDALQRIKSGNFGICIVCSNLIEKGRLEAVPHARMCVNCKQETKAR